MCGICGVIGTSPSTECMEEMLKSIEHRGPDDEGIFTENDIFLGHRRLSILDLSALGHQPLIELYGSLYEKQP